MNKLSSLQSLKMIKIFLKNKKLNTNIETMFLMSDVENQIISAKFVKEIANLGGDIDRFVTRSTVKMLKNKY